MVVAEVATSATSVRTCSLPWYQQSPTGIHTRHDFSIERKTQEVCFDTFDCILRLTGKGIE